MRTARPFLAAGLTLLGLSAGLQPARAAEGARCSMTFVIVLAPGFSVEPSTGTHHSEAPGVLDCEGAVGGSPITGAGTLTDEGPYGTDDPDSCTEGSEGAGIDRLTVPTRDGPQHIDSEYRYTASKMSSGGPFRGEFSGTRFSGTFDVRVLEGDCVTKPVTKVELKLQGLIHE
jgi:hypothetical protein